MFDDLLKIINHPELPDNICINPMFIGLPGGEKGLSITTAHYKYDKTK